MTISYHVRPPHVLYPGFNGRLRNLDDDALAKTLRDYETYRLDMTTGELLRDQPGGYQYVAATFGRKPVALGVPTGSPRERTAARRVYRELGAKVIVEHHESGTTLDRPFEWVDGLLMRPSDFSVTRWTASGDRPGFRARGNFWWNMLSTPRAADYNPTAYLKKRLAEWRAPRPPLITCLIHENNFYRARSTPWALVYYADIRKSRALKPPFNLGAPDASVARSPEDRQAIWSAYEEIVAYAAANLKVVTSEDIVRMAESARQPDADRDPPSSERKNVKRLDLQRLPRGDLGGRFSRPTPGREPRFPRSQRAQTSDQSQSRWRYQGIALQGRYADADVVEVEPGRWRMYVVAQPEVDGNRHEVYVATSTDGKRWHISPNAITQWSTFPDVIHLPDGHWRIYYQRRGELHSSLSDDGISFEDEQGVRIARGGDLARDGTAASTTIVRPDGTSLMVYRGQVAERYSPWSINPVTTALLAATSKGGLLFRKQGAIVEARDRRFYGFVDGPELAVMDDGKLHLFFWTCAGRRNREQAGIYEMVSDNFGQTWEEPVLVVSRAAQNGTNWGDPTLAKINGKWHMYFGQGDGIHYAILPDRE